MSAKSGSVQRIIIWVIVIMFAISSLGFTGMVIWDMIQSNSDDSSQEAQLNENNQEGKLEGTKLENFEPVAEVDKLQVVDIKTGDGEVVKEGATVTAHYTGALAKDGTIFQSSKDTGQPATFPLSSVIEGWKEGVPGMKVGGIRRIIIPAEQAYGEQSPSPNIPPNSDLVFDIELVSVQ